MMEIADSVSIVSASGKIKPKTASNMPLINPSATNSPQISLDQFERSVQLVKPDREITEGAKAVLETLAYNSGLAWLLRTYQNFPLFAKTAETIYYFIAKHRSALSSVLSWIGKGN